MRISQANGGIVRPFLMTVIILIASTGGAQFANVASFVGAGDMQTSKTVRMISSWTSQAESTISSGGTYYSQSGFINAFTLKPQQDTDGDGLSDENDPDNDNDGLDDAIELAGAAFAAGWITSPYLADTDGDGLDDGQEAVLGTNPLDSNAFCKVEAIHIFPDSSVVSIAVNTISGYVYQVEYCDNLLALPSWSPFANTNEGVGKYTHILPHAGIHRFEDDFSQQTTRGFPAGGVRHYRVKAGTP